MRVSFYVFTIFMPRRRADLITGEGHFDDGSAKPSGTATPIEGETKGKKKAGPKKGAKKAKKARFSADGGLDADGDVDIEM